MLSKRIIPCLDVHAGRTTKGVKFVNNIDVGDPVEMARHYYEEGADELVFYDITASAEGRGILLDVVRRVAAEIFIPFAVGGGLNSLDDLRAVLLAGAEKVSVNTGAIRNPGIIAEGARAFGRQCVVLGMDVLRVGVSAGTPSGYEVVTHGGRRRTGRDALAWAREAEALGAGEICLNSIDADGTRGGYEIALTRLISTAVGIPVIASGGAGTPEHLVEVLTEGCADAALVASMVHFGGCRIRDLKAFLAGRGVKVRAQW
ncbi:MAG: Imidazole glycerol phosphate synthase subunit HisF [Lentisphaerae bacterium ADurb.BinA184]|nr:MAG: Imidazole glycerol phosphate synthase subunit HisF [Lentisphaerae bacterium ADurb.BinA184]